MRKRGIRVIGAIALAMLIAGVVATVTGSLGYVTTHGSSMEPGFHEGDLALIRSSDTYETGDVVAYHSELLDTVVMHRIVDRTGDTFIFKGDNNSWLDRDQPTADEFRGKLLLRIPRGGLVMGVITRPWALAIVSVVVAGLGTRRRRLRRPGARAVARKESGPPPRIAQQVRRTAWGAAAALVASLLLASAAFGGPVSEPRPAKVNYTHQGEFRYSAPASDKRVYETGEIMTGEPVFLNLVDLVEVDFDYQLASDAPRSMTGTIGMRAEIRNDHGWHRTIELSPDEAFNGDRASVTADLDLIRLKRIVEQVEMLTGVVNARYDVTVFADVDVEGSVAGRPLSDAFSARLGFSLDRLMLVPATGPIDGEAATADPYQPSQPGSVSGAAVVPRKMSLVGRSIGVENARTLSVIGAGVSALVLGLALILRHPMRRDEPARIEARHGRRIIPIATTGVDGHHDIIDVTTMDDLVRLAEQYGCLILNRDNDGTSTYLFQMDRTIYRYQVSGRARIRSVS